MASSAEFTIGQIQLNYVSKTRLLGKLYKEYKKKNNQKGERPIVGLLRTFKYHGISGVKRNLKESAKYNTVNEPQGAFANYTDWITDYDTLTEYDIKKIKEKVTTFTYKPLLSIITPVYNSKIEFLEKAIQSVQNQLYTNWELCIADDASTDPDVKKTLEKFAKTDNRIKLVFRKENGHISEASNSAIAITTGEFIALMDHDDELASHALFMVVNELNKNPKLSLLYSDEDKIDTEGNRTDPYFKSEWSPELLYAQDYISHLSVYKADIVKKIGGFRKGFEGSQDYDLLLRFIEQIKPEQIKRIPAVLYHWRIHPGSTALHVDEKNYAVESGLIALQEHLQRTGQKAKAEMSPLHKQWYRVKWQLPATPPLVSLIIPTKDKVDLVDACIKSILKKTTYTNYEIIIVDNNSTEEESKKYFKKITSEHSNVRVLEYKKLFNFSAINNFGVANAKGSIIGLINNDIVVINEDWLDEMVRLV
ncbi:MAG TPA: glycosyltransferase, partial [Bacteroidia bacterium]|nr:glycosyltransferase [Bacteroidia bacterium]